jgi:hypothetical protein
MNYSLFLSLFKPKLFARLAIEFTVLMIFPIQDLALHGTVAGNAACRAHKVVVKSVVGGIQCGGSSTTDKLAARTTGAAGVLGEGAPLGTVVVPESHALALSRMPEDVGDAHRLASQGFCNVPLL